MSQSYQSALIRDRYAQAALAVTTVMGKRLLQPDLTECAWYLAGLDAKRLLEKGKPMSEDHLKQEAVKWAKGKIL